MEMGAGADSRAGEFDMPRIVLVTDNQRACPFAQKTLIGLRESGLPFETEEVSLTNKPGWFLELNPLGQVPVLVVGSTAVPDSEATLSCVASLEGSALDAGGDAAVRWRRLIEGWLQGARGAVLSGSRDAVYDALRELEPNVHEEGPYLCGEGFTAADAALAPFVQRLEATFGLPEDCPRLRRWWSAARKRDSVRETIRSSWWWWW